MTDQKIARAHGKNIVRYRRLLQTPLSDTERQFIEMRLNEEQSAMDRLAASSFDEGNQRAPLSGNQTVTSFRQA